MSYNYDPVWTDDIVLPDVNTFVCPACGALPDNLGDVLSRITGNSYYHPRHFPSTLVFTCNNVNCIKCDEDFAFKLHVVVTAVPLIE